MTIGKRSDQAATTDLSAIARRAKEEQERSHGEKIPLMIFQSAKPNDFKT